MRKNGAPWWLRPEQGPHIAGGVHVGKDILTLVRTVKISCSGMRVMRLRTAYLSHAMSTGIGVREPRHVARTNFQRSTCTLGKSVF